MIYFPATFQRIMEHECEYRYHNEGTSCILCAYYKPDDCFIYSSMEPELVATPHEQLSEICEKLGFGAYINDVNNCFRKLRRCNNNRHLNTTLLASVYYTINQEDYLPLDSLLKFSEIFTPEDSCKLFKKIQNIIHQGNLIFPAPSVKRIVEFVCNQIGIKPKYWDEITLIANSIREMYLSHGKCSPNINCTIVTALHIFTKDLNGYNPCHILFVPRLSHKRMVNQLRKWGFIQRYL